MWSIQFDTFYIYFYSNFEEGNTMSKSKISVPEAKAAMEKFKM